MIRKIRILLSIFIVFSSSVLASGGEEPEGGEEAPKKEGASESKAYQEIVQKINKLDERVKVLQEEFGKAVHHKRHSESADEKHYLIEQMKGIYLEYSQSTDNLNKLKKELRYRFPSEGEATEKAIYSEVEKKSPEQLEQAVDFNGVLSQIKDDVDIKYKVFQPVEKPKPEVVEKDKEEEPKRLRLER